MRWDHFSGNHRKERKPKRRRQLSRDEVRELDEALKASTEFLYDIT